MSNPARPLSDVNLARLAADAVPQQIRAVQAEIAAIEKQLVEKRSTLRRLIDTAVLYNVELFPQQQGDGPAARASGPGGTDTPPGLAGTDGVMVPRVA